ncbi:MAG: zf-HC2 domain-containing protein [Ktedonobacteraceae bacterium]
MNCTQAQELLAAYRELQDDDQVELTELDEHLEQCASCRQALAHSAMIGEQIRALPPIEPPPGMHEKLMRALAAEHSEFMKGSGSEAPPPPAFLKPYLPEHPRQAEIADPRTTFSTAETGPLPVLPMQRKRRRPVLSPQFTVIGLAAAFLLAIMVGGLTSLVLLAHTPAGQVGVQSVSQPTGVLRVPYTTDTTYQYVTSAVADGNSIYYTAYGDSPDNAWMLERLDRATQISTPLLATASSNPLIVLGSAHGWLVWLQLDVATPIPTTHKHIFHYGSHDAVRTWSLRALSLKNAFTSPGEPAVLLSGTFNAQVTPVLVHTPIQGIWFTQNTLLVASVDETGTSHLLSYQLSTDGASTPVEIAKADPGHIFTSPTTNNDGTMMYWADEWLTDTGTIHSNIWTQQAVVAPAPLSGRWGRHTITETWLFRTDGLSFHPTIVDNTLFILNTNDTIADGSLATAQPTTTVAPEPTVTMNPAVTPQASDSIYLPPLDDYVSGTLFMLPLDTEAGTDFTQISTAGHVSALQGGKDFILWQEDNHTYGMYDVVPGIAVNVGSVLDNAQFVSVNGNTTVWTVNSDGTTTPATNNAGPSATIMAFNWPKNTR